MNEFLEQQIARFKALKNQQLKKVTIVEFPIFVGNDNEQSFYEHPLCPFIQSIFIFLKTKDNLYMISNYQNDCIFGICIETTTPEELKLRTEKQEKTSYPKNFPLGKITDIAINLSKSNDILEILLEIEEKNILLKAGEVEEGWENTFAVNPDNNAILIFTEPEDIKQVKWSRTLPKVYAVK